MSGQIKILIADDHSVVRQGVALMVKEVCENILIVPADNFTKVIKLVKEQALNLIILDISIPAGKGIKMMELIKAIQPEIKILIFSACEEDVYAIRYLKMGADGYLNKLSSEEQFKAAFWDIVQKGSYISETIRKKLAESITDRCNDNPLELLSKREMEIANLLVKGEGNLEIANKLNLHNSTVSTYKNRIFDKLSITNTVALVGLFKCYDEKFEL